MNFIVNTDCIGCGLCEETCPECFKLVDGLSHVVGVPNESNIDLALKALEECPTNAIKRVDD